jgi:hypothetical protein
MKITLDIVMGNAKKRLTRLSTITKPNIISNSKFFAGALSSLAGENKQIAAAEAIN